MKPMRIADCGLRIVTLENEVFHSETRNPKSEMSDGFTLVEVLVAFLLFTAVMLAALLLFKQCVGEGRARNAERAIYAEATAALGYIEQRLASTVVNDLEGANRIDFIGAPDQVRFVAAGREGDGSDLVKLGFYRRDERILVAVMRVTRDRPEMTFSEGFPGAQVLCENAEELKFAYYDGGQWKDTWNTGTGADQGLPAMIRADLTVGAPVRIEGRKERKQFSVLVVLR